MDEKEVFNCARRLAVLEERVAYLQQVCGHEPKVLHRLLELLRVHDHESDFLECPAVAPDTTSDASAAAEGPGNVIGPYKLLEQIGEGGMGLVFMADQTRPVRRRVALKVLKPGMDTRQVVARFEGERQALALMDHPHIAHVFDAGTTASGRPYFVMELVRGVPITEFCDQRRLTTRQRLELFVSVCQAVQHAHQKGIIHRDLKPSNVLVTLHDTLAVPKVIDFGIAKATTGPLTEQTVFTRFAQLVGTPLYMSPEQAEMNGLDVDTRSDVYSLGVLLYELLTGTTPFESDTLKQVGLDEMRRMIREEEPPPPSRRLSTLSAQACTTIFERRGVDSRQLRQLVRGELDWIVMKALEKDRDRRYESASAFAADVQRYLNDEAVAACPPTAGYRLGKYVRRNRRVLMMVGIVAFALVAATLVSTWQAVVARDAQAQAEADRDRAEASQRKSEAAESRAATEAAISRAVNDFLERDVFGQVDTDPQLAVPSGGNPDLTVKEVLDRAAAKIGERFQDQPLVEAGIRMAIGAGYERLKQSEIAAYHFERAIAIRLDRFGPDHPATLASMQSLATRYVCRSRYTEGIALRQRILESRMRMLGPDHPETLSCQCRLAYDYEMARQWDASVPLYERVLEKQRALRGPTHPETLGTMHALAINYEKVGRLSESMALHEKVLEGLKSTSGSDHGLMFGARMNFAQACQRAGELDRADQLLREALAFIEKQGSSRENRATRGRILGWMALTLLLRHRYIEAEPLAREAVAVTEKEQAHDPARLVWVSILGAVLLGQQRYTEAEPLLLQAYEVMKKGEATHHVEKLWIDDSGERVVRFYEATNQPKKARAWREKVGLRPGSVRLWSPKVPHPELVPLPLEAP
jgi:serine/threonine protein kinase